MKYERTTKTDKTLAVNEANELYSTNKKYKKYKRNKKHKNRKKIYTILTIVCVIIILAGTAVIFQPQIENTISDIKNQIVINNFNKEIESNKNLDLDRLYRDVKAYNKKIYKEKQSGFVSNYSYQEQIFDLTDYGFTSQVYGYVSISSISVNMPIYLGASDYNMSLGAAQLTQTSVPLGGKNTNAVIAGHCGYGSQLMFRYLENVSEGDIVEITTPFDTLKYKVTEKRVIKPTDLEAVKIQKGKDMVTLFTCYPYPTSNYRICIFANRVKN